MKKSNCILLVVIPAAVSYWLATTLPATDPKMFTVLECWRGVASFLFGIFAAFFGAFLGMGLMLDD